MHDGVLAATVSASFKLFLMCGFTGWLLQSGRIPQESATVLSKASAGPQLQGNNPSKSSLRAAYNTCIHVSMIWLCTVLSTARPS